MYCSTICNSTDKESTQVSTNRWKDKENVEWNIIWPLKGWNSVICDNRDEPGGEISQAQKDKYYMILLVGEI
jgi:hypothetical protein